MIAPLPDEAGQDAPRSGEPARAEDRVVRAMHVVLGVLMLVGVALNAANVFSRYVLGSAIFWTEEVLVVITIWGVFLGVAGVAWKGEHLSMDLFSARLRGPARTVVNGITALCFISVCAFVAWQSWSIVAMHAQMGSVSPGAQIPRVIPHSALAVGFALSALVVAWRIRLYLRGAPGERA